MDQHDPSRRHYAPSTFPTQQQQQEGAQSHAHYATPGSLERFRQSAYLQQSPTSVSSAGRAGGDPQQVYSYAQGPQYGTATHMQHGALQYEQDMQTPEVQRQPQQQYSQYGANAMYGMHPPQTTQSPYEQIPRYSQRPSTASETLSTEFGVPQTAQYYLAAPPGPTSAAAPELTTQQLPSQYQQPSPYAQPGASSTHAYPGAMMNPPQPGAYMTYAQQQQQPQYTTQQPPTSTDEAFDRYSAQTRTIFTFARDGSLRNIAQQLLDISHYLLGNAEALGLTRDDEQLHDGRIRLWDEFNRAWLVTLQRQFDLTQEIIQSGRQLAEPQSIMDIPALERLSQELVRLCDSIERHGLVDYQMGVAEENIMDLLLRCLSLLDPNIEGSGEGGPHAESSTAGSTVGR